MTGMGDLLNWDWKTQLMAQYLIVFAIVVAGNFTNYFSEVYVLGLFEGYWIAITFVWIFATQGGKNVMPILPSEGDTGL